MSKLSEVIIAVNTLEEALEKATKDVSNNGGGLVNKYYDKSSELVGYKAIPNDKTNIKSINIYKIK